MHAWKNIDTCDRKHIGIWKIYLLFFVFIYFFRLFKYLYTHERCFKYFSCNVIIIDVFVLYTDMSFSLEEKLKKRRQTKSKQISRVYEESLQLHTYSHLQTLILYQWWAKTRRSIRKKNNKINWKVRLVNVTFLIWVALCRYSGRDTAGAMQTPVILSVNTFSI